MIKIDIVSGFLGAGKTTLLQKLVEDGYPGEKLALLENEYGDFSIDSAFLRKQKIEVTNLLSGCICCSLSDDFRASLITIIEWIRPDHILIEPSGVAKLSDIIDSVLSLSESSDLPVRTQLDGVVAVVDATKINGMLDAYKAVLYNQINYSGCIILSRTEDIDRESLDCCVNTIRAINQKAIIITTPWDQLSSDQIRRAMYFDHSHYVRAEDLLTSEHEAYAEKADNHHSHEHNHEHYHEHHHEHQNHDFAEDLFNTVGLETAQTFTKDRLIQIMKALDHASGNVLRAKGLVSSETGSWYEFDYVPTEHTVRIGSPETIGKICVIGEALVRGEIENLFLSM
ncbi:GTP-binding protein [Fusibacter paucivorans]|uniref:GTP-binding protein n=1 Tax=Fusibacter paucivorans TaxID=76009 RepID=A0ABS5PS86_9FIRM|nr:CobW family GTP-binding protein [Fusibacter paucivorans]MBS7527936.1 GTP-binding protein [Fusibacter paucivorans]